MGNTPYRSPFILGLILLVAIFYNAPLAFINAHVMNISTAHVMAVEAMLLAAIGILAFPARTKLMTPWVIYSFIFVLIFLFIAFVNASLGQSVSPKPMRDVFIVTAFGVLGILFAQNGGNIVPFIRAAAIMVVAFIVVENYLTSTYTWLFDITKYYLNTRGVVDDSKYAELSGGLFVNTQLIEGRFTLGFLASHRLSSLFLEQTSLANFAILMAIASSVFWDKLARNDKIIFLGSSILSIMATDSRMAFGVAILVLGMHFATRYLPRNLNILYMPLFVFLAYLVYYDPRNITLVSDDLPGRFTWSLTQMSWIDWVGALGGRMENVVLSMDSGYSYVIYAQSIFGLALFWLFTTTIMPQNNLAAKKFAHMSSIFLAINLMVGPTVLSIKAAALLWFMAGYLYYQAKTEAAPPSPAES